MNIRGFSYIDAYEWDAGLSPCYINNAGISPHASIAYT